MNGADATGDTEQEATLTNVMVLDRATGELVPVALSAGTSALVVAGLRQHSTDDRANATEAGEQIRNTDCSVTVTDNTNGASVTITGNTTIGNDTEAITWSQISMPRALRAALAISGAMAPHIEARIVDMLNAVQDGMDWDDAYELVVGESMTEEREDAVEARIADLRREVTTTRRGRQQASRVVVTTE